MFSPLAPRLMPQAAASPFPQDNDEAPRVVPAARLHSDAEALDAAHALAADFAQGAAQRDRDRSCLLYTSPSPRDS